LDSGSDKVLVSEGKGVANEVGNLGPGPALIGGNSKEKLKPCRDVGGKDRLGREGRGKKMKEIDHISEESSKTTPSTPSARRRDKDRKNKMQ